MGLKTAATEQRHAGSYTVLARRYRSRDFDELIGQEPIARTLKNAITAGRTAHAYLFCGTRGVGKTSMARIFARALNVTEDLAEADAVADAIMRGDDLDVIEIDAASNRGINEARDLIAAAGLSPARSRYKIYIIDEVHMLTKEAFNALLKTMEEPPPHVKFILCTTEAHRVPATIQSRCQRFDFRLLPTAQIAAHLRHILDQEGLAADDEVVATVARLGRGSMRDALSMLDRLLASGEATLTAGLVEQMLGLPDQALAVALVDAIADGDVARALDAGAAILDKGSSVEQALETLIEHLRNLMLISACGRDSALVELSADARKAAAAQAEKFDTAGLVHMIALCDAAARAARDSVTARALFDAVIARLCVAERLADIAALLEGGEGPRKKKPLSPGPPGGPAPPPAAAEPADEGRALWARVRSIAMDSPNEHAMVEHLAYRSLEGSLLRLAAETDDAGLARWLAGQSEALAELVRRVTAKHVRVAVEAAAGGKARQRQRDEARIEAARELPIVQTAMELFDARVVDVSDLAPRRGRPGDV